MKPAIASFQTAAHGAPEHPQERTIHPLPRTWALRHPRVISYFDWQGQESNAIALTDSQYNYCYHYFCTTREPSLLVWHRKLVYKVYKRVKLDRRSIFFSCWYKTSETFARILKTVCQNNTNGFIARSTPSVHIALTGRRKREVGRDKCWLLKTKQKKTKNNPCKVTSAVIWVQKK